MAPRTLQAVLFALVVVTAGCLAGAAPGTDDGTGTDTDSDDAGPTITVSATGSAQAEPDQAIVRVAVVARGDDPAAVRDDLAAGADALRGTLADAGVDDVATTSYTIGPEYRTESEDPERFRGVHAFTVTVAPDQVGTVVDAAADAGAVVQGIQFTLSEDARRDARADALAEAMGDARSQADVVASEADLAVAGVRSATTSDLRYVPYEARADGGASATTVEPGPVTVTATVQVVYDAT